MHSNDPVDAALAALARQAWPGSQPDPHLEQRLMQAFQAHTQPSFTARHRILVPVLAVLLVGTVAFAASGGYALVRNWVFTMTVNGQVVYDGKVQTDEQGNASFTVPLPEKPGETTIDLTGTAAPGESQTVSVTVTPEGDDQARVTVKSTEDESQPAQDNK